MITAVDTNILLDILIPGSPELFDSRERLAAAIAAGPVVICDAVYAEVSIAFQSSNEVEDFLHGTAISLARSQPATLYRAAMAWLTYLRQRSNRLQCPRCGYQQEVQCERCATLLRPRQHLIADFLIGAHALMQADRLLTRDRGYYATYFPELTLA